MVNKLNINGNGAMSWVGRGLTLLILVLIGVYFIGLDLPKENILTFTNNLDNELILKITEPARKIIGGFI